MEIVWRFSEDDIQRVRTFLQQRENTAFVRNRINRNVKKLLLEFNPHPRRRAGLAGRSGREDRRPWRDAHDDRTPETRFPIRMTGDG